MSLNLMPYAVRTTSSEYLSRTTKKENASNALLGAQCLT